MVLPILGAGPEAGLGMAPHRAQMAQRPVLGEQVVLALQAIRELPVQLELERRPLAILAQLELAQLPAMLGLPATSALMATEQLQGMLAPMGM